ADRAVALLEPAHQLAELGPIGLSARDLLAIDFDTTGRLEVGDLAGEVLVAGGNPRISDDHFSISFRKQHMEFSRPTKSGQKRADAKPPAAAHGLTRSAFIASAVLEKIRRGT